MMGGVSTVWVCQESGTGLCEIKDGGEFFWQWVLSSDTLNMN